MRTLSEDPEAVQSSPLPSGTIPPTSLILLAELNRLYRSAADALGAATRYALDERSYESRWAAEIAAVRLRQFTDAVDRAYADVPEDERLAVYTLEADRAAGLTRASRAVTGPRAVAATEIGAAICPRCGSVLDWFEGDDRGEIRAACCCVRYFARPIAFVVTTAPDALEEAR